MNCNMMRLVVLAVGILSFAAWARPSLAAPTVYFDRDDVTALPATLPPNSQAKFNQFTNGLVSYGVNNIETVSGVNPALTFGATGITANTQGVMTFTAPTFTYDSQALFESDAFEAIQNQINTVFTFNQAITAFGLFVIQGGDGANNSLTTFRLTNTTTSTSVDALVQIGPGWGGNNAFFVGFHDSVPFDKVEIIEAAGVNDAMFYDNVVAGNIPEPGSLALLLFGGACALCRCGRNRRG